MLPESRKVAASEVPVVDLGKAWHGTAEERREVVAQIRKAAADTGFMYLANHGIAQNEIDRVFAASKGFHALPDEVKEASALEKNPYYSAWLRSGARGDDFKGKENTQEAFQFRRATGDGIPWPSQPAGFKEDALRYFELMSQLGYQVLELFEEALGVPQDRLAQYFRPTSPEQRETQNLRLLRYKAQAPESSADKLGARAHTDSDAITMLYQDTTGGLEVRTRSGEWLAIPPIPGTFVLNVGEVLKVWSDGVFTSSTHRVINRSGAERFSVVFFFDPLYDTVVEPVLKNPDPDSIAPEDLFTAMPRDKPFVFGDFKLSITKRIMPTRQEAAAN